MKGTWVATLKEERQGPSVLEIDLERKAARVVPLPVSTLEQFIGGRGLGAALLYEKCRARIDPLSPENPLVFSAGPLQATDAYYAAKTALATKSPLTNAYLYSVASGSLGHHVRRAGYEALVFRGRAAAPVWLVITESGVQFIGADGLWGSSTTAAQLRMSEDAASMTGNDAATVAIGPAGEKLSPMACVATGGAKSRTFGRGGAGAVMGSKNLKGFVVYSENEVTIANPSAFQKYHRAVLDNVKANPDWSSLRRRFGSAADVMTLNALHMLPTRNWQEGSFSGADRIAPTEIESRWRKVTRACGPHCPTPCAHQTTVRAGSGDVVVSEGPEYETIYAFGANCGLSSFDAIIEAERLCDEAGIDTMSCGCTLAFAMECFEKGLITETQTDGLNLRFGNADAVLEATRSIAESRGFGRMLSQGTRQLSLIIPGSSSFAMHAKGMEFGGYECHGYWGQALQYAINSRGGCHHGYGLPARTEEELRSGMTVKGKGYLVKKLAVERTMYDSAVVCAFARKVIDKTNLAGLIQAATGRECTLQSMEEAALRSLTLERLFNAREGFGRNEDSLPHRLTHTALREGAMAGTTVPLPQLLDDAYAAFGWDRETGSPTAETLEELGLPLVSKDGQKGLQ